MIPTGRFWSLLLIGGTFATGLSLLNLNLGLAGLALWDLGLCGFAFWDARRNRPLRVTVRRLPLGRLSVGRANPVRISLSTPTPARLQLQDDAPFDMPPAPLALAAGETEASYTVFATERGRYGWGDIHLRQHSPWGLVWDQWRVCQPEEAVVYPDLVGLKALALKLAVQSGGGLRQGRAAGAESEFAELREYANGDDLRLIHWPATARLGKPLVRVLEPEQEQTLVILLDRGRLMDARVGPLRRFDWGLNAALALALAALTRGDRVGVGVFDRQMHLWLPPERGRQRFAGILDRLAGIAPELVEPDYAAAAATFLQRQPRRSLVVLLTDIVDLTASAEMLAAFGRLAPRHLPFCVALRDPRIDRQAADRSPDPATAFARAVALDLLAQRRTALARLQRSGALVLDAPADEISQLLVEQYLRLKRRPRL